MIPSHIGSIVRNSFYTLAFYLRLAIFSIGIDSSIDAQDLLYPFEKYNEQDGLTAPVRKIIQDHFGFIWLASSDGLYRFDGIKFTAFRNKLGDTTAIPNNIINDFCVHPNGQIWIASNGGLCYYSYEDNRFHQIDLPEYLEKTDRYRVHAVSVDFFGQIWFATKTAIHLLDDRHKLCKTIPLPLHSSRNVSKLYAGVPNLLFVGSNNGELIKLDLCTNNFQRTAIQSNESLKLNLTTTIIEIYPYMKDTLLVTSWFGGLHKVVFTDTSIRSIPINTHLDNDLQKNVITGIAKLKPDLWWLVTNGSGIIQFNPKTEKYIDQIKYSVSNPLGLMNDYINHVFIDKSGIVWIATDEGLNKYDRLSHPFFGLKIPNQKNEKSIYRRPSCILEDRKSLPHKFLWISIPGIGLFHYDREMNHFEFVTLKISNQKMQTDFRLSDMIYNKQNQLILCTNSGIYIFNEQTHELEAIKFPEYQKIENVRKIIQDKLGNYWFIVSSNGLYCYKPQENQCIHYANQEDNPNSLPDNSVFCLLEDHESYIWIGMQNRGLSRLNPKDGTFMNFEHFKLQSRSLPDNNVYDLYEDPENYLWVATENGLARMNPERSEFKIFTTSEGLSNNDIFFITPGIDGKLWMGTNNGISVLDPKNGSIIIYSQIDGLASNRIEGATVCCKDGYVYFGTNGMLSGCNPAAIVKNEIPPDVFITSIKVHGQEIALYRTGRELKEINLNYNENNFSPEFIALNYTNSERNKYAYYLEGYDKHWNYCGSQKSTTYTNLSGGNYTFKVKASNNDGIWSVTGDQIAITIQPPFWNTWWFYVLIISCFIIIVYIYFTIKIKQIVDLQKLRLDIARDLHDDVGSTLSSINMTSSMAEHLVKSGKNQTELFHIIQSASKKAMEMMNEIIWSIKPENDKPEMMLSRMRQYASEILESAGIDFEFKIIERAHNAFIPLHLRKDLFMIFKEALNNLAKYSNATSSKILLTLDKSELQLVIEDNGIGFNIEEIVKGNGLKNMKERASALKAIFKLESKPGDGTRIDLNIKF